MCVNRFPPSTFDVPEGADPAYCPYCDRPFSSDRLVTYHVGHVHGDECSDHEREAFDAAREDEEYELFTFHLKAAVSVFLIYFMFSFIYALVWAG